MSQRNGEPVALAREMPLARARRRSAEALFDTASGSILRDTRGREYLDFLAGGGALNYGHNDPDMCDALVRHIGRNGIAMGADLHTSAKRAFLEAFHGRILEPRGMNYRVHFTGGTGGGAVKAAIRLARRLTGRLPVVAFSNGRHGTSLGTPPMVEGRYGRVGAGRPGLLVAPYDGELGAVADSADVLERLLADTSASIGPPAAILLEVVQGEGGLDAASPDWVRRVAAIARRLGALLIVDDAQAGCGRTGRFFSFEHVGVRPDLIVLSRSLSGFGLPMAALLARPDRCTGPRADAAGALRGHTHALVTARVAIEKFWLDGGFAEQAERLAQRLQERLEALAALVPGARAKGRGTMQGLDVGCGLLAANVARQAFARGLLVETAGPRDEVLKILPPLTTPLEQLERGFSILRDAIATVAAPAEAEASAA